MAQLRLVHHVRGASALSPGPARARRLVCGVLLQLIVTLDYAAIGAATKEFMEAHYATFQNGDAAPLVARSLAREAGDFEPRNLAAAPALRCGAEALESKSSRAAHYGSAAAVKTDVVSTFRGMRGSSYQWSYRVTFVNQGSATVQLGAGKGATFPKARLSAASHSFRLIFGRAIISRRDLDAWMLLLERNTHIEATSNRPFPAQVQLLTRAWRFADAFGGVTEVSGPGVRGDTPVLRGGESWSYESGTTLPTATGSFYGSFSFEILELPGGRDDFYWDDAPLRAGDTFVAPVDRLALTASASAFAAPWEAACPAPDGRLPCTAVNATRRVIVGVTASPKGGDGLYGYDVQINNARNGPVRVVAHEWKVASPSGEPLDVVRGLGLGRGGEAVIDAGDAVRFAGELECGRPDGACVVVGTFRVRLGDATVDVATGAFALRPDCAP